MRKNIMAMVEPSICLTNAIDACKRIKKRMRQTQQAMVMNKYMSHNFDLLNGTLRNGKTLNQ